MRKTIHRYNKTPEERLLDKVVKNKETDCWEWTGAKIPTGYGTIRNTEGQTEKVHRMAFKLFCGDPGDKHVLHRCDVRNCLCPWHLFLGTHKENMADCRKKDRKAKGRSLAFSVNNKRRLTEEDVMTARRLYAAGGITHKQIALRFGVHESTMRYAIIGKHWKWLPTAVA